MSKDDTFVLLSRLERTVELINVRLTKMEEAVYGYSFEHNPNPYKSVDILPEPDPDPVFKFVVFPDKVTICPDGLVSVSLNNTTITLSMDNLTRMYEVSKEKDTDCSCSFIPPKNKSYISQEEQEDAENNMLQLTQWLYKGKKYKTEGK